MDTPYFSVRMHAGRDGRHLSGGEDLVPEAELATTAQALLSRALGQNPHDLQLHVEPVPLTDLVAGQLPDLVLNDAADVVAGRNRAMNELLQVGISEAAARSAMSALAAGAAPGGQVMRGAMMVDAQSGRRLEADPYRGVRVSRFGWDSAARSACTELLQRHDLGHFRTREALALAAKVLAAESIIAELCWSDDPDYTAGYVATKQNGYLRIPHLKSPGDRRGGRAFFVAPGTDVPALVSFLEQTPFLIRAIGALRMERT